MEEASTDHVKDTVVGAVVGAVAVGGAVALLPVVAPALGLAAVGATAVGALTAVPWLGAAVGGWWGYSKAEKKAITYGFRGKK